MTQTGMLAAEAAAASGRLSRWQAALLAPAVIGAVWLGALSRWLVTDSTVPWDAKNQFYAFFRFLAQALHSGSSGFWNPYHYGGHPSIADPQSLLLSPMFLAWAWFDPAPSMRVFDMLVFAHLLVGGLAVAALGRRRGWPEAAAVLAAVVFMLGGAASSRLNHSGIIVCYGLFPLALLALEKALSATCWRWGLVAATTMAVVVLGRNQVALMLCLVMAVLGAREWLAAGDRLAFLRSRARVLALMLGVGVALTAVPLLLTLQFAALSNRPEVTVAAALEASLHPANLMSLLTPNVFGAYTGDAGYWGPGSAIIAEVAATDESFNSIFVGLVAMTLVLWLGLAGGRLRRPGARTWAGILAAACIFCLGRYTPVFGLVFQYVPGFAFFRRPVDASFVMGLAIAMLSGELLAGYVRDGCPPVRRWAGAVVGLGLAGLAGSALVVAGLSQHAWQTGLAIACTVPAAAGLVVLMARANPGQRPTVAMLVALLAAGELVYWNAASPLNAEAASYYRVLETADGEDRHALAIVEAALAADHKAGERPRVEIIGLAGPWQNLAVTRRIEATNGYNPLRIGLYDRLVAPGEVPAWATERSFPATFEGYDCALAKALGLGYLVMDRPLEKLARPRRARHVETLLAGPRIWIYRIGGAMPRVRFQAHVEVADADAVAVTGELAHPPVAERVTIDDETPPVNRRRTSPGRLPGGEAKLRSWAPDKVEVDVDAALPGVLVLHDSYYPGWIAEVDGAVVKVLRADVLFRGVEVPEGRHRVTFRFRPLGLDNLRAAVLQVRSGPRRDLLPADFDGWRR